MTAAEAVAVVLAGAGAGTVNAVVGSGTLLTFPVLLATGLPPVTANVTSTLGLVPGSLAAALGYREELRGQGGRLRRLGAASVLGGAFGAALLLVLPEEVFGAVVPWLVLLSGLLVLLQPRLARAAQQRGTATSGGRASPAGVLATAGCGTYGGYFGAAQGVLLIGVLGTLVEPDLQRANALKNALVGLVNATAAAIFVLVADVRWEAALLVALGALAGGWGGARLARRLPRTALRYVVAAVGLVAGVLLLVG